MYSPGSAPTSLTMMSQKQTNTTTENCPLPNIMYDSLTFRKGAPQCYMNKRKLHNTTSQNDIKMKAWNFVPISNIASNFEFFASPKCTPIIRKNLHLTKQISEGNIDKISATPNTSTLTNHIKYANSDIIISAQQVSSYNNPEQIKQSSSDLECRSQSVPLQYKNNSISPIFINTNYNEYSSACNSIAHTPVSNDFNDFEMFSDETTENTMAVSSRSVPSTPLINNIKNQTRESQLMVNSSDCKMLVTAKSMPTTPISSRGIISNIFRYSPDFNRDSLINGNTYCNNDNFEGVNILPNHSIDPITTTSISGEIEELEQFANVEDIF